MVKQRRNSVVSMHKGQRSICIVCTAAKPAGDEIFLRKFRPDNLGPKFRRALTRDRLGELGPNFQDTVGFPTATKAPNKIRVMGVV